MAEEERYSNRQIERMLDDQSTDIKKHIDLTVAPLLAQVKKTNGRVGWLEKMVWMACGAVVILAPLTTVMVSQVIQLKDLISAQRTNQVEQIQHAVNQAVPEAVDNAIRNK